MNETMPRETLEAALDAAEIMAASHIETARIVAEMIYQSHGMIETATRSRALEAAAEERYRSMADGLDERMTAAYATHGRTMSTATTPHAAEAALAVAHARDRVARRCEAIILHAVYHLARYGRDATIRRYTEEKI